MPTISIHALREEGDLETPPFKIYYPNFYPRPPRGGRRLFPRAYLHRQYFYPRPPRGGRRTVQDLWVYVMKISIHALREEGDRLVHFGAARTKEFLSTPSARRATRCYNHPTGESGISIHALREEGDGTGRCLFSSIRYFYPRPPRGGRPSRQSTS